MVKALLRDKFGNVKLSALASPLFSIGVIIKLVFAFCFASDFLEKLFIPFVDYFVSSGFHDPYAHFYDLGRLDIFPYPAMMLWSLSIFRVLFSSGITDTVVSQFELLVYRLPILLADFCILVILLRWLKTHSREVLIFYWLSPILIYINYIHGQYDVIPTAFLFVGLYLLFKEKFLSSAAALGLALACKTHILIVLPFFFLYMFKSRNFNLIKFLGSIFTMIVCFLLPNWNYISTEGFRNIVFANSQQIKIFDFAYLFQGDISFYVIPAVYLLLIIFALSFRAFDRDIFVMFLGFGFAALLAFIPPVQGWYYWILPQLIYFYIKERSAPLPLFILLNLAYFVYFLIHPQSDYLQVLQPISSTLSQKANLYAYLVKHSYNAKFLLGLSFTSLQTLLFLNCFWVYKKGVESNLSRKLKAKPYLIAVSGDSGAGKSTYSQLLTDIFGGVNTTVIRGDDMHKYERGDDMWKIYTHLNPKANRLHDDTRDALMLKQGESINRRHYDHSVGRFTLPKSIEANKVVIFEGLHTLYLSSVKDIHDLKVFINPNPGLRTNWKLKRDVEERSKNKEEVLGQMRDREGDSKKFIQTQEKNADIIVNFFDEDNLKLRILCDNAVDLEPLLGSLSEQEGLSIRHSFEDEKQIVEFDGDISVNALDFIAFDLVPEFDELFLEQPSWSQGYNGILQIFTLYFMFQKLKLGEF